MIAVKSAVETAATRQLGKPRNFREESLDQGMMKRTLHLPKNAKLDIRVRRSRLSGFVGVSLEDVVKRSAFCISTPELIRQRQKKAIAHTRLLEPPHLDDAF